MTGPLLIVADDYRQATHYAREHDLGPEGAGWIYATEPRHVQGRHPGRFVYLTKGDLSLSGLLRQRDVIEALRAHGFTEITC